MSIEELQVSTEIPQGDVSHEWLLKFFNRAGDVSNAEMQKIWAKVLAGEIIKPKSFSARTIDVLANLTQAEAKLFENLSQYMIQNFFYSGLRDYEEMNYESRSTLQDAGLLNLNQNTHITWTLPPNVLMPIIIGEEIAIGFNNHTENTTTVRVEAYFLTNAGNELLNVIKTKKNDVYIQKVAKIIKNQNQGVKIYLCKANHTKDSVLISNAIEL